MTVAAIVFLRGFQIGKSNFLYAWKVASRLSRFSGRPNPFKSLFRSQLLHDFYTVKEQNFLRRLGSPARLLLRIVNLTVIFGSVLVVVIPLAYLPGIKRRKACELCHWALRMAGATFIKLGQWASTRPDILPPELCTTLAGLHSNAPTHSMSWNQFLFQKEFGRSLEDIFETFDPIPIGSGTIAQVHRATLRAKEHTGRQVAVKISHPHIAERIDRDLQLINMIAILLDPLFPSLNLSEEARYFSIMMHQQLDLRHEAYTLDHFSRNFATWRNVHVAIPIYPFVSYSILTETLAFGTSIGKFIGSWDPACARHERKIKRDLAYTGLSSFLQMLLWDNFIHADLHPGNILVRFIDRKGMVRWSDAPSAQLCELLDREQLTLQLVYLDTGLVTQLSRRDRKNFDDLFLALVLHGDGHLAGRLLIERSPVSMRSVKDPEGFCRSLDALVRPIFRSALELHQFALGPVLFQVFELVRIHNIRLDGSFTNIVMSFICMEGLGRELAPDLNLIPLLARGALRYLVSTAAIKVQETTLQTLKSSSSLKNENSN